VIVLGSVLHHHYDLCHGKMVRVSSWLAPLALIMLVSILAETNRSPFDFAEGESELVSGFNTEYASVIFMMLFLAEYMAILFISYLRGLVYYRSGIYDLLLATVLLGVVYVWARGTLPRFRYDQLIYLAWKAFLPIGLTMLLLGTTLFQVIGS